MFRPGPTRSTPPESRLAFKAYEIEELADVYFFRPAGFVFAVAARTLRLTPTQVTIVSIGIGIAGGALLYWPQWALAGFALIVFYGVLDSTDGQLARMTGQTSEFGRLLDGIGGYAVYGAIYPAIVASALARGHTGGIVLVAIAAALANAVQAQLYDYHRTAYARVVIDGTPPTLARPAMRAPWANALLAFYERLQRSLLGLHAAVETALTERAAAGDVRPVDRQRYRRCFYGPVRAWNLFGDNTRFYAIGVLAWLGRLDWFFVFLLVPMNIALALAWRWQTQRDRKFLAGL